MFYIPNIYLIKYILTVRRKANKFLSGSQKRKLIEEKIKMISKLPKIISMFQRQEEQVIKNN